MKQPTKITTGKIDKAAFLLPAILTIIFISFGLFIPETFSKGVNIAYTYISTNFSWFYALGTTFLLLICFWAGFSKHGKIKLGGKDAKPDISIGTWFAITFTTGMGMGIVFYSVGEPLMNYMTPPGFTGLEDGSLQAAEEALKYVFVHWGLQPYALYTATALGFAIMYWNCKQKFRVSSGLYTLLGHRTETLTGKIVNGLSIAATVGAIGTTCGLGILQISKGVEYVFGVQLPPVVMQGGVMAIIAVIYIVAACSGIHKGIKYVSTANLWIFIAIMVWTFLFSNTVFILNNTTTSIGKYIAIALPQVLYLEPAIQSGWVSDWTIFYWAWWVTTTPLVALFIIKLAKGRTVRQFVAMNLVVPVCFIILWFGIFGSGAIGAQMAGHDIWGQVEAMGFEVSLFAFLETLPLSGIVMVVGLLAVLFSFVTMAESMTFTMADMTMDAKGSEDDTPSPWYLKVFWGVALALTGLSLTLSGGLTAVQTAVIAFGAPTLLLLVLIAVALIKFFLQREKYDKTLSEKDIEAILQEKMDA